MKTRKRFAAVLAMIMALCLLAGCGAPAEPVTPDAPVADAPVEDVVANPAVDTITVAYNKVMETYTWLSALPDQATASMIYEPLWRDVQGEPVPCIAKSWEWTGPTTLHVVLNDDVYDTNGNQITASDVLWSYEQYVGISSNRMTTLDLANSKAVSDFELDIAVTNPSKEATILNLSYAYICSQKSYEASEDDMALSPVGTGPYKLAEHVSNSHCILEFNEDWHLKGEEAPQIKRVKILYVSDAAQRLNVLSTKEASYSYGLNFSDKVIMDATEGVEPQLFPSTNQLGIYFNMNSAIFKDNPKLRQAICYAINREAISQINKSGLAPAAQAIGIAAGADYNDAFKAGIEEISGDTGWYDYDIEKAKALLAESGVAPGTKIRFLYYTTAGMDTLAKYLEGVFQELGLVLELDFQSNGASYSAKMFDPDGYDITPLSLEADPISGWFVVSNNWNMNKFADEAQQKRMSEMVMAAYTADGEERTTALLALEKEYYDNCLAFPIYDDVGLDGRLSNVNPFFNAPLHPDYTKWVVG